jgi:hypothetical protein
MVSVVVGESQVLWFVLLPLFTCVLLPSDGQKVSPHFAMTRVDDSFILQVERARASSTNSAKNFIVENSAHYLG